MTVGRIMALDHGSDRIGVAVSDPLGITAQPHSTLDSASERLMDDIRNLAGEMDVELVVVGLPVSLDGTEGPSAAAARHFAAEVGVATGLDVEMVDERFTSNIAERVMIEAGTRRRDRREARDRVAAAVFLQSYLDGRT
jgi:putative Holliday junction resolvase